MTTLGIDVDAVPEARAPELPTAYLGYMQTFRGRLVDLMSPRPEDIDIEDIAHALSQICRFGGHSLFHYSVAQHSVLVSQLCEPADALAGLLHDAHEIYVGDVILPLKMISGVGHLCERIERQWVEAMEVRFGLSFAAHPSVKKADLVALATERRDVMAQGSNWRLPHPPAVTKIERISPTRARLLFITRFVELTR